MKRYEQGSIGMRQDKKGAWCAYEDVQKLVFNPCDPERGDLMKVAMAAELFIHPDMVYYLDKDGQFNSESYIKNNYQSKALAILRAAGAVYCARGEV